MSLLEVGWKWYAGGMELRMCNQCHARIAKTNYNQCKKCIVTMSSHSDKMYRENRSIVFLKWVQGEERICWLCHKEVESNPSADHVTPIAQGGSNELSNLRLTHVDCNRRRR